MTRPLLIDRLIPWGLQTLARDLQRDLFPAESPEAERLKITIRRNRHLDIHGGRWKQQVTEWLQAKGF